MFASARLWPWSMLCHCVLLIGRADALSRALAPSWIVGILSIPRSANDRCVISDAGPYPQARIISLCSSAHIFAAFSMAFFRARPKVLFGLPRPPLF